MKAVLTATAVIAVTTMFAAVTGAVVIAWYAMISDAMR